MTQAEKILYHQIHPAKLATDIGSAFISLYFFWEHRLWLALALHVTPPIVASVLVMTLADLDWQKNSAFGRYVVQMMTRTVEAVRLVGDLVMVFGAWYHSIATIVLGLAILLVAWFSGVWRRSQV